MHEQSIAIKTQLQQEGPHNPHKRLLEHPSQVTKETVPLGFTRHLLHKVTLPRLKIIADLPNTLNKQTKHTKRQPKWGKKETRPKRTREITQKRAE